MVYFSAIINTFLPLLSNTQGTLWKTGKEDKGKGCEMPSSANTDFSYTGSIKQ